MIRKDPEREAYLEEALDKAGNHWLDLIQTHPIKWEGGIDGAMKASCDHIKQLEADNVKLRESLEDASTALGWAARRVAPSHRPHVEADYEATRTVLQETAR